MPAAMTDITNMTNAELDALLGVDADAVEALAGCHTMINKLVPHVRRFNGGHAVDAAVLAKDSIATLLGLGWDYDAIEERPDSALVDAMAIWG